MTLSNSRQQFLAYESQEAEDLRYGRRGGIFISRFICFCFVLLAIVGAVVVGIIVFYVSHAKYTQEKIDFWDTPKPFGPNSANSKNVRLSNNVVPSFYRIKLKPFIQNSTFSGEVYITLKSVGHAKEIILHAKDLKVTKNIELTEQIYEKLETVHPTVRSKRDVNTTITEISEANQTRSDNTTYVISELPFSQKPNESLPNSVPPNSTIETTTDLPQVQKDLPKNVSPKENSTDVKDQAATERSADLGDTQVTHSHVRSVPVVSVKVDVASERLILSLGSPLTAGVDYILQISFEGNITDALTGFYKSSYTDSHKQLKELMVTQFEPVSARAAFPCFDEPEFKAKFEISIAHPSNISVLSNMIVSSKEEMQEIPGWNWTHFERSVKMSTYLVAYVLSEFKSLSTSYLSQDNVTKPITVWAQPDLVENAEYAVSITPKLLMFYENVFGVPYALNKLDLIAIPDFSSGAMENWGLITFRETTLLYDKKEKVPRDKQNVAIDVAHELAHQWFGNLVTMRWWTDLWLNEGFATYIEYIGVNHIEPEWHMLESFTKDKMELLRSDALKNTSPVSRVVADASEIGQKFDEISYSKGASLIRMLNHTITEPLFHKGLVAYLNKWKYSNAEENDLWEAMAEATRGELALKDFSIVKFMNSWTKQAGYPVLHVKRDYTTDKVKFEQELFTVSKEPYDFLVKQIWHIPISYTTMDAPVEEWTTMAKVCLKERSTTENLPLNTSQALYVNIDAIGYYRVNYDIRNWDLLSTALKSGKVESAITRAQLLDDAFNLAKAGKLDYVYPLDLTTYLINGEDSKLVWEMTLGNLAFMKFNLVASPFYVYFQDYMIKLLQKQLEKLNYGLDEPKNENEALFIESLLSWECLVDSPRCINWAKKEFEKWTLKENPDNNPIPSYLRSIVYSVVLKHGGRTEFDFLWSVFENTTDPNVKSTIITCMPSTRQEYLLALLLERGLTVVPNQYAGNVWGIDSKSSSKIAQDFLINNWDRVYSKFYKLDTFLFPAVLNGAFGFMSTISELNTFKAFAQNHQQELKPLSQTLQKIVDTSMFRIEWLKRHSKAIEKWLKEFANGNSVKHSTDNTLNSTNITQKDSTIVNSDITSESTTHITVESTTEHIVKHNESDAVINGTALSKADDTKANATTLIERNSTVAGQTDENSSAKPNVTTT